MIPGQFEEMIPCMGEHSYREFCSPLFRETMRRLDVMVADL